MNLYVIGVNHKTAPLSIREKFSIGSEDYDRVLSGIMRLEHVTECALLSTCNRTELHIFSEAELSSTGFIEECFCDLKGLELSEVKKHFFVYEGMNAIRHIIKLASGMDSLILGEDQILGQFRKAYEICMKQGASKAVLNTLSRLAVTSSKKIKTRNIETGKASTLAGQVVELLRGNAGIELTDKNALIIGSGEVGRLVSEELLKSGVTDLYMTRRSCLGAEVRTMKQDEACKVPAGIAGSSNASCSMPSGVIIVDYQDRYSFIDRCDIIIGATSSPHYTITRDVLEQTVQNRTRKRYFIDLAVPRDFDEAIGLFVNASIFNIDDLKQVTDCGEKGRRQFDMQYIQEQINSHAVEFLLWFQRRKRFMCPEEA